MIRRLAMLLACRRLAAGKSKTIMSRDGSTPYITRIFLLGSDSSTWFRVTIHIMHRGDEGQPHNHRWAFLSMVLIGGFYERMKHRRVWRGPGSVYLRGMNTFHKVELPEGRTAATLVFMFPRVRADWGFLVKLSRNFWVPHVTYLNHFFGRNIA